MEFGQTPKQLFDCPHPQRCLPMQTGTAENVVVSNGVDTIDGSLSDVAGAGQSFQCLLTGNHINRLHVCLCLESGTANVSVL